MEAVIRTTKTAASTETGPTVWVIQRPRRPRIPFTRRFRFPAFLTSGLRRIKRPTCNQTPRLW